MNVFSSIQSFNLNIKRVYLPPPPDTITQDGVSRGNLILYYKFQTDLNNYKTYNASGTYDISVNYGASIASNSLEIRPGKNLLLSPITFNTGGITVLYWIKVPLGTLNTSYKAVIEFSNGNISTDTLAQYFFPYNGKNTIGFIGSTTATGNSERSNTDTIETNTFYHFVFRIGSGTGLVEYKWYINNVAKTTYSLYSQSTTTRNNPYIGRSITASTYDASFNMYEFRLYNRVLNDSEISSIFYYGNGFDNSTVSKSDLVFYYKFKFNTDNSNIIGGSAYNDISANSGTTIDTNSLKVVANQFLTLKNFTTTTNGISIAFWIKAPITNANNSRIFDFGNGSGSSNIFMYFNSSNLYLGGNGGITTTSQLFKTIVANTYYHVAWTIPYDSVSANIVHNVYVDGTKVSTSTWKYGYPDAIERNINYIGKSNTTGDPFATFNIGDFRLYNRVLTDAEITILSQFEKPP